MLEMSFPEQSKSKCFDVDVKLLCFASVSFTSLDISNYLGSGCFYDIDSAFRISWRVILLIL